MKVIFVLWIILYDLHSASPEDWCACINWSWVTGDRTFLDDQVCFVSKNKLRSMSLSHRSLKINPILKHFEDNSWISNVTNSWPNLAMEVWNVVELIPRISVTCSCLFVMWPATDFLGIYKTSHCLHSCDFLLVNHSNISWEFSPCPYMTFLTHFYLRKKHIKWFLHLAWYIWRNLKWILNIVRKTRKKIDVMWWSTTRKMTYNTKKEKRKKWYYYNFL